MTTVKAPAHEKTHAARVLLVDDHPIVRQGLGQLINEESDLVVCGEVETVDEAVTAVRELQPAIAVVDLSLRDKSGIELIKTLRDEHPDLPVLVLSMHDESLHAERALRAGAKGYIMKQEAPETLLTALRRVLGGGVHVSEKLAARMLNRLVDGKAGASVSPLELLSDRELEVFKMIGQGMTPREIAERLNLSVKTVETHRERMKDKLKLKSGNELLRYAMQYAMDEGRQAS